MDSALRLAQEIMDDLVWGRVSSWQYWIAVSRYNFRDGLIYVNESEREIVPIKRLWAMGNFSRFIRPGYRRFEVGQNSATLHAVGCMSPDGARLVVVVMNPGSESQEVELHFAGGGGANILDVYETSRANDLQALSHGSKDNKYSFPAESVTTLIIEGSNIKTLAGDVTYTSDDRAMLAEFSAKAYDSNAIKAMKID